MKKAKDTVSSFYGIICQNAIDANHPGCFTQNSDVVSQHLPSYWPLAICSVEA